MSKQTSVQLKPDGGVAKPASVGPNHRLKTIVRQHVDIVLELLAKNAREVVEEGGLPLTDAAHDSLFGITCEIVEQALRNPRLSIEDFVITPFARDEGGAYLLVDFSRTGKRLSFLIAPDGTRSQVAITVSGGIMHSEQMSTPLSATGLLGWLTMKE